MRALFYCSNVVGSIYKQIYGKREQRGRKPRRNEREGSPAGDRPARRGRRVKRRRKKESLDARRCAHRRNGVGAVMIEGKGGAGRSERDVGQQNFRGGPRSFTICQHLYSDDASPPCDHIPPPSGPSLSHNLSLVVAVSSDLASSPCEPPFTFSPAIISLFLLLSAEF